MCMRPAFHIVSENGVKIRHEISHHLWAATVMEKKRRRSVVVGQKKWFVRQEQSLIDKDLGLITWPKSD